MKILYLCSQNKRRSLTVEKILNGRYGHEVRSAGTENNSRAKVTEGLLGWADIIVAMEKKHSSRVRTKYHDAITSKPIICMDIPDDYMFMNNLLIQLLYESIIATKLDR